MTALAEAKAHLRKAQEFLEAAEVERDLELFNAATSSAVTSGINSKDAICLALTASTGKTDRHADAVSELRRAGPGTKPLATILGRLLKLKSESGAVPVARRRPFRCRQGCRVGQDPGRGGSPGRRFMSYQRGSGDTRPRCTAVAVVGP